MWKMGVSSRTSCLQLLLLVTWMHSRGVEAIRAVTRPINTTGVAGREAVFSCSVEDKSANEILTWRLQWDHTASPQTVFLTAEQNATTFEFDETVFEEKHATYTTRYSVNGSIHTTVLHIANVQPSDAGSAACLYQITVSGSVIARMIPDYPPVRLTVLTLPAPTCSYTNLDPNMTAYGGPVSGAILQLACADTVGVPAPELIWCADDRNSSVANRSVYYHELQDEDNGRWFECQATSPATTPDPVICRIQPMAIPPTATVIPDVLNITEGGNIEFTCTGSGLPEIASYQWFLDGSPINEVNPTLYSTIKLTNTTTESILKAQISKPGETVVTCEVMVSAGFTGRAIGVVVVKPEVTMAPVAGHQAHSQQKLGIALLGYAIPAAVLLLILILMVTLLIWHRRLRSETMNGDTQKPSSNKTVNGEALIQKQPWKVYSVTTV